MRLLTAVVCAALVASALASPAVNSGRVVGGTDAILGQFVHQGFVQNYARNYVCGVWIHSWRWAIAPAYYMTGRSPADTFAVFGTVSTVSGGTQYPITQITVHPNFNANTLDNNIALLYIENTIDWYPYVHPIPLATEITGGGVVATMAGWSRNDTEKHYVSQRTLTNEECQARQAPENRDRITERVICVDTVGGIGGCLSSAGNALISGEFVIGSFSWGVDCTEGSYPDVYTRISYYGPWIYSVVGALDLGPR